MRYNRHLPTLLALPSLALASFKCDPTVGDIKFDLSSLKGSHSVITHYTDGIIQSNTTWTINPCEPIDKDKDLPSKEQCPDGTQVCGVERILGGDNNLVVPIPIAGDIDGRSTDPKITRLKTSDASSDANKEGVRVVLSGGLYKDIKQQAIIEFLCDPDRTGLEEDESDGKKDGDGKEKREEEKKKKSLTFVSYDTESKDMHTLRLEWKTKHACETATGGDGSGDQGSGWGFFTWFIIILFLGVAAYLIFGSWLNYNRYGARGWDLLPHSDTIRDVPYLLKDWARRVIGTLQGRSGGRGGYSAV